MLISCSHDLLKYIVLPTRNSPAVRNVTFGDWHYSCHIYQMRFTSFYHQMYVRPSRVLYPGLVRSFQDTAQGSDMDGGNILNTYGLAVTDSLTKFHLVRPRAVASNFGPTLFFFFLYILWPFGYLHWICSELIKRGSDERILMVTFFTADPIDQLIRPINQICQNASVRVHDHYTYVHAKSFLIAKSPPGRGTV